MSKSADILTLTQWFSPGFPVGAFSYSHGLEWAIDSGAVNCSDTLRAWVSDVLTHGTGTSDALFLREAAKAGSTDALARINQKARAYAPSRERRLETELQGDAFCQALNAGWGCDISSLVYPVAVGRAASLCNLHIDLTVTMYLHAFASNLVTIGMRLIPLGQTEGQNLIREMATTCEAVAAQTEKQGLEDLTSTAFLADIAAMHHETQHSRICRT